MSSIGVAGLWFGVAENGSTRHQQALFQFLKPLEIADFDCAAAQTCGPLRARLAAAGSPTGPLDRQRATHALALGVTLLSDDAREFGRIPGLLLDNRVAAG